MSSHCTRDFFCVKICLKYLNQNKKIQLKVFYAVNISKCFLRALAFNVKIKARVNKMAHFQVELHV